MDDLTVHLIHSLLPVFSIYLLHQQQKLQPININ
jgi:hypothetical protein